MHKIASLGSPEPPRNPRSQNLDLSAVLRLRRPAQRAGRPWYGLNLRGCGQSHERGRSILQLRTHTCAARPRPTMGEAYVDEFQISNYPATDWD
jgi:hypothetical protein